MKISYSAITYCALNTGCAIASAYIAPSSFAFSFTAGMVCGLGLGLKRKVSLLLLDANEKIIRIAEEKLRVEKLLYEMKETQPGQYATQVSEAMNEYLSKYSCFLKPVMSTLLHLSGYGKIVNTGVGLVSGFDEQRKKIIQDLNPIPGWKGTLLSLTTLAANVGYIASPILSKVSLFSGFTAGYATGLYVANISTKKAEPVEVEVSVEI